MKNLKDINGKDIEEGDTVGFQLYRDEPYQTGIIVWDIYTYTIMDVNGKYVDELYIINELLRHSQENLEIIKKSGE